MCGQYYYDSSTFKNRQIKNQVKMSPGQPIPVYLYYQGKIILTKLTWGYSLSTMKDLIINAKSETLLEKKLFHDDFLKRRCIIAAKGFYQKDTSNHRISFESETDQTIYMAGIYNGHEVTIITTSANEIMQSIHPRMPLMIPRGDVKTWLTNQEEAIKLLKYKNNHLKIVSGHYQQSLFE